MIQYISIFIIIIVQINHFFHATKTHNLKQLDFIHKLFNKNWFVNLIYNSFHKSGKSTRIHSFNIRCRIKLVNQFYHLKDRFFVDSTKCNENQKSINHKHNSEYFHIHFFNHKNTFKNHKFFHNYKADSNNILNCILYNFLMNSLIYIHPKLLVRIYFKLPNNQNRIEHIGHQYTQYTK